MEFTSEIIWAQAFFLRTQVFKNTNPISLAGIRQTRFYFILLFKDFIYLFETGSEWEREREHTQAREEAEEEGEADFLLSREPNEGLDSRTLGLWPELKAGG